MPTTLFVTTETLFGKTCMMPMFAANASSSAHAFHALTWKATTPPIVSTPGTVLRNSRFGYAVAVTPGTLPVWEMGFIVPGPNRAASGHAASAASWYTNHSGSELGPSMSAL